MTTFQPAAWTVAWIAIVVAFAFGGAGLVGLNLGIAAALVAVTLLIAAATH